MKYNAATGAMCFASALVSMKKGGKVRRAGWHEDCGYTRIDGGEILLSVRGNAAIPANLDDEDILAEDWQEALVPL